MSTIGHALAKAFWHAADDEERRARGLPIIQAKDSNGEEVIPGDLVQIVAGSQAIEGSIVPGRSITKQGASEWRDIEIRTSDGTLIPFRSHRTTKISGKSHLGVSDAQLDVIVRLGKGNQIIRTGKDDWNTSPIRGRQIRLTTLTAMTGRGWLSEQNDEYRITPHGIELGKLYETGMMEKS